MEPKLWFHQCSTMESSSQDAVFDDSSSQIFAFPSTELSSDEEEEEGIESATTILFFVL